MGRRSRGGLSGDLVGWKGGSAEWGEVLPEVGRERPITLFEGNTPLFPAPERSRRLGQGGRTVLLTSHLLGEVEQICHRVGVIQRGKLVAQGTVAGLRGEPGLLVRAEPAEKARRALGDLLGQAAVKLEDGAFRLTADPARAAEINTRLVQAGLSVSELRTAERSLEEVFLQLTGEESGE